MRTHTLWPTWTLSVTSSKPVSPVPLWPVVSQKDPVPTTPLTPASAPSKSPVQPKDFKDVLISALYHKKLALESQGTHRLSFALKRDHLVSIFVTLMTLLTAVLFVSSPSDLFPKWYIVAVILMLSSRVVDYVQKKEHFYLIDLCYTAGAQILFFLIFRPHSVHLATRAFAFGSGVLGWSTILLSNGLTIHRLDEFCSLWIHTVPSLMAYTLRWTNENSVINYKTAPFAFTGEHMLQYYSSCYLPYMLWVFGYYLIINKVFKNLTIEGDYMTLVKFVVQKSPMITKLLDVFGAKYRGEAFMMFHLIYFTVVTSVGYICFFNRTFHTCCIGLCVLFAIFNGTKQLVADLRRPYEKSVERINTLLATLG